MVVSGLPVENGNIHAREIARLLLFAHWSFHVPLFKDVLDDLGEGSSLQDSAHARNPAKGYIIDILLDWLLKYQKQYFINVGMRSN